MIDPKLLRQSAADVAANLARRRGFRKRGCEIRFITSKFRHLARGGSASGSDGLGLGGRFCEGSERPNFRDGEEQDAGPHGAQLHSSKNEKKLRGTGWLTPHDPRAAQILALRKKK